MHAHSHGLSETTRVKARNRLYVAWGMTLTLFVAELVGGFLSDSLALLSDAGHMFGDLAALTLTLVSIYWATRRADPQKTFGYHRAEVLATFINGALLTYIGLQISWEAFIRLAHPETVRLSLMLPIATAGLLVNIVAAFLLHEFEHHMVTRSAFYHVLSDALSSVAVIVGGLILYKTGLAWIDPAVSLLIVALIFRNSYLLLKEGYDVLMEGSPSGVDLNEVRDVILKIKGVEDVHDLHIWTIGSGFVAATAHVLVHNMDLQRSTKIVDEISHALDDKFHIHHSTMQIAALPPPAKIQKI